MNIYITKVCVLSLLMVCRLVSGLCPLLISRKLKRKYGLNRVSKFRVERWVGLSMDFSGGLLLATCFVHMIPEVRHHLSVALQRDYNFPYAETLVCVGFFIVFVIEESARHVARRRAATAHQPPDKAGALIPAAGGEDAAADSRRCFREQRETSPASADPNVESCAANGVGGPDAGLANAKSALESNPMMTKEELALGECNNNAAAGRGHTMKNVLLVSALSFHSVMEGLAIGLALDVRDVWYLFLAVTVHECTILVCVGIELVTSCPSAVAVVAYMAVLALVSPAGVFLGMLLTLGMAENTCWTPFQSVVVNSLQGLAAGTILYVTFFEVLNNHKHHHHHHHQIETDKSKSSISQLIFILLGFLFMVVLELIGAHDHEDSPNTDCHSHGHLPNVSSH